jgi:hypothetical protein
MRKTIGMAGVSVMPGEVALVGSGHQAPTEARRVPLRRRPPGRHQPLSRRGHPKPFTLTAHPGKIIAAVNRGRRVLESIH